MANRTQRPGITYDQVADIADLLTSQGQQPTIRIVRETIGGSPNTVHKHLTTWRESRAGIPAVLPDLPTDIIQSITREIQRASAEACLILREQLTRTQAEAAELAAVGELLEAEQARLLDRIDTLNDERSELAGKSAAQQAEIERLHLDLGREREASAQLHAAAARAVFLAEKTAEQATLIQQLTTELDQERERRISAEQSAMTHQFILGFDQEHKGKKETPAG